MFYGVLNEDLAGKEHCGVGGVWDMRYCLERCSMRRVVMIQSDAKEGYDVITSTTS